MTILPLLLLAARAQATLYAAGGKADVTPDLANETTWMAGYDASGRKPKGVHDPMYARGLVVSDGDATVAFVAVDCLGLYREDVEAIRKELGWIGGKRYLFLGGTHTHSGPDTEGMWGRFPAVSGVNPRYHERLKRTVVQLVKDLAARLREAKLKAAGAGIDPRGLCRDIRDPVVVDPELDALQFKDQSGLSLGTLVRWSCHAEVMGRANRQLTPDYPGALCRRIEQKTGGPCVFFPGSIGGMMTPDVDHSQGPEKEFSEVERVGARLGDETLKLLKAAPLASGKVSFRSKIVLVPVQNSRYLLFLPNLVFGHRLFDKDGAPLGRFAPYTLALRQFFFYPLPADKEPRVETELSRVDIGPVRILGVPGELFPELAIGGYDGRYRFGQPLISPANPNPPNLKAAPKGPYLRERLGGKPGIIIGLANDHLGYILPNYDFQITNDRSLEPHPPGDHYEETNSIGPAVTGILLSAYDDLLKK